MVPSLMDGDVVVVNPVGGDEVGVGDIVCFAPQWGSLCLHRVIASRDGGLVVKGDAVSFRDLVAPEQVLGRAVAVERRGRTRRLDRKGARLAGRLIACVSPLLSRLIPPALALRRVVREALRA